MLWQSSLLSTVISFVYKTNAGSMKARQLPSVWKLLKERIVLFPLTLTLNSIKLENLVMQLKRQPIETCQNEKHYSKDNNTSENPISRREISQALVNGI